MLTLGALIVIHFIFYPLNLCLANTTTTSSGENNLHDYEWDQHIDAQWEHGDFTYFVKSSLL